MEKNRKTEKTIDVDALIRWGMRKWRSGTLLIIVAMIIGGCLGVFGQRLGQNAKQTEVLSSEEKEEIDEYLEYNLYRLKVLDIIDMLEKNIEGELSEIPDEMVADGNIAEKIAEPSDEMTLLELYRTYYNSVATKQNNMKISFTDSQIAYLDSLAEDKKDDEFDTISIIKYGVKISVLFGMVAGGIWIFGMMFVFGFNKKIKSKEDILFVCGDIPVIEGMRGIVDAGKVKFEDQRGLKQLFSEKKVEIIYLADERGIGINKWDDELKERLNFGEDDKAVAVLAAEIGVSLYKDVKAAQEEWGERMVGCLCVR